MAPGGYIWLQEAIWTLVGRVLGTTLVGRPWVPPPTCTARYTPYMRSPSTHTCLNGTGYLNIGFEWYINQGTSQYTGYQMAVLAMPYPVPGRPPGSAVRTLELRLRLPKSRVPPGG